MIVGMEKEKRRGERQFEILNEHSIRSTFSVMEERN